MIPEPPLIPSPEEPAPKRGLPSRALVLAFLPAVLVLTFGMSSGQNGPSRSVLWAVCGVSVVCCFTSAFLLFRRRTGWAIVLGILFLLLNSAISLFVGCVAAMKDLRF